MSSGRKNLMLGTAGHVDHGKSALVKLLTGCETDTLAEEKQRGLTIDLGFAPCRLRDERVVGIVDVPGHVDFIRNMVAGAHGIDVVMFVVAADDGIMPQTLEHLQILTLMGLKHGLVALTKIDLVEPGRLQEVIANLRALLQGTFLESAPVCPLSNITGEGFDNFFDQLNRVVASCTERSCRGAFRVWVEDVFTIRGSGTVITGIPSAGRLRVGDTLELQPGGARGRVRRLQVYGETAEEARAGECAALNLPELDHTQVKRGMLLSTPGTGEPARILEAELHLLGHVRRPLPDYFQAQVHIGTGLASGRVALLEQREIQAGQRQFVQLRLETPLPAAPGERFVLRANVSGTGVDGLTTIGGGRVLGTSDVKLRRNKPWTLEMLERRSQTVADPAGWLETLLLESPRPVSTAELLKQTRLCPEELAEVLQSLAGRVIRTPAGDWVHASLLQKAEQKLTESVQAFHASQPNQAGMDRTALLASTGLHAEVASLGLQSLTTRGVLTETGTVIAAAGWGARVTSEDERLSNRVSAAYEKANWCPPLPNELASSLNVPSAKLEQVVRLLVQRGVLVRLDGTTTVHRNAVEAAKRVALGLFARGPSFSTMDFRDALAVSRKYAVPLLDHLDRVRFTVRNGNTRSPGAEARKQMTGTPLK